MAKHIKTEKEYFVEDVPGFVRFAVVASGVCCLIVGVGTLLIMGILGALDGIFVLLMGWGIMFKRSRACAVIVCAYYALNHFLMRISPLAGYVTEADFTLFYIFMAVLLLGIYGTFTFRQDYKEYLAKMSAELPEGGPSDPNGPKNSGGPFDSLE